MTTEPVLRAELAHVVTEADTAIALGSGDVPVLATPRLLAWCEEATVQAIAPALELTQTTVGVRVELDHLAATPVGGTVRINAEVVASEGSRYTFAVHAEDDHAPVATGTVVRARVDRERFLARLPKG